MVFIQQFHSTVQVELELLNKTAINDNKFALNTFSLLQLYKNANRYKK